MAKRQNFVVGSTNAVTQTMTPSELNHGFDQYEILTADELDGVFNAVSDFSNDSSNEIANAIQSITGSQPTGGSQTELANALQQMRNEIETTSLTFKGYIATSAPSSSTYALVTGNIWINSATMPTSFPVAASSIKQWDGSAWVDYGSTYTPADFDFFRNINDNEGYYWFGGLWTVMSTDMDTTYFELNPAGKWTFNDTTKNISNWSSNVSNCITEIPQDINLELNNGTLTLKAGSKVYVPNGAGVFDEVVIANDIVYTYPYGAYTLGLYYNPTTDNLEAYSKDAEISGTTPANTCTFYNISTNNISRINNGTVYTPILSFPIATITTNASQITSIDQVFNGFGYIGSTVFVLPGLKGLIPNGRNADGSLKNTEIAINTVRTLTPDSSLSIEVAVILEPQTRQISYCGDPIYNKAENLTYDSTTQRPYCQIGRATLQASKITAFTPKTVFHAVDYNDFQTLGTSKANTSLDNVSAGIDFVVESQLPTAQNNYTWYRKYKSGWVEQGGYLPATGSGNTLQTVNLPKAMSDAHYTVTTSITDATAGYASDWYLVTVQQQTSTGFKTYTGSDWGKYWSVSGMAA